MRVVVCDLAGTPLATRALTQTMTSTAPRRLVADVANAMTRTATGLEDRAGIAQVVVSVPHPVSSTGELDSLETPATNRLE